MWVFKQTYGVKPTDPGAKFALGYITPAEGGSQFIPIIKEIEGEMDAIMLTSYLNGGIIRTEDLLRIVTQRKT